MACPAYMKSICVVDKGVADVAERGKYDVKQRVKKLLDDDHLKAQVCIDHKYMYIRNPRFTIDDGGDAA